MNATTHTTGNLLGLMATPAQDTKTDEQHPTALAAALYIAQWGYDRALTSPNPAARLDDMCDAADGDWADFAQLPKLAGADLDFAETMRSAAVDRLWAFAVIEHNRTEVDPGCRYVFDVLADSLKAGADPHTIRADVRRVTSMLGTGQADNR